MILRILQDDYFAAAHYDKEFIAWFHTQGLARLARNDDLVLYR